MLQQLENNKYKLESVQQSIINNDKKIKELEEQLTELDNSLQHIVTSRQYYKKAVDIIYERSIQELKDVINSALLYIFKDRHLEVDIELSDKRGKSMTFLIRDNGNLVSLKRGMGMGVKCVISAILHIYFLQCKNSKVLMLDEAYSNISKDYLVHFFEFISKLCQKLEFKLVIITHDERFIEYADKVYKISQGNVSLIRNKNG